MFNTELWRAERCTNKSSEQKSLCNKKTGRKKNRKARCLRHWPISQPHLPALWVEVREAAELFIYGFLLCFVRTSLWADDHEPEVCKYSFSHWWLAAVTTTTDEQDAYSNCSGNYRELGQLGFISTWTNGMKWRKWNSLDNVYREVILSNSQYKSYWKSNAPRTRD